MYNYVTMILPICINMWVFCDNLIHEKTEGKTKYKKNLELFFLHISYYLTLFVIIFLFAMLRLLLYKSQNEGQYLCNII